ncbi:MAG: ATP-dependent RecD-like DNA helicase [Eubacteriales bacterium]|nr:ATP-dependent RecD-like DNA helicase [Eubacteriales bacterium]
MEEKTGILADIIYHNKENGYTIAIVENEETQEQFTAVGCLPGADRGRTLTFTGAWKIHPTYGEQFAFQSYKEEIPHTPEGIEGFLASGLLRGIGKKTAAAIVMKFGEDSLRIIEEESERLMEVSGIGRVKAKSIGEAFKAHREFAKIVLYFQQYGISTGYAMKLYKVYGSDTIRAIEENPYQLVDDIFGIGFRKADRIAEKLGMDPHSPHRIYSAILYTLWTYINEGHTFVPQKQFCELTGQLLDINAEEVYEMLIQMAFEGDIHIENVEGRAVVYLMAYYLAEQKVCRKLIELEGAILKPIHSKVDSLIDLTERQTGILLTENQRQAVKASLENGVNVITGGPGTGKTTIINTIMNIFKHSNLKTAIAAPTGRAAKRITETSGNNASTIHRLLEYYYSEGEDSMRFGKNEETPLDYDVIIIDEASMIDIILMKGLLEAIPSGTRLILVGDADQLPSVGAGNVLRDIINSEIIPSVKLTEIFRQASESLIVVNAHKINQGDYPDCNEKDKDFFLLRRKTEKEMLNTIQDLCSRRLPSYFKGFDAVRDVQVLTPVRKGNIGSINLNRELQKILNPPDPNRNEKGFSHRLFREGDKVMQIKNNYQLEWKRIEDFSDGQGVFNGDCGFIETIDTDFNQVTVVYEESKYVKYDFSQLDELELAYAITVHKSQGSEFPIVIMPISWFPPMLATRNLLYTAITRAKEAVILVGSESKMHAMIDNNRIIQRDSGLAPKLKEFLICESI